MYNDIVYTYIVSNLKDPQEWLGSIHAKTLKFKLLYLKNQEAPGGRRSMVNMYNTQTK